MNDKELDEMLNQWDTPPVRSELRENVRAGFAANKTAPRRRFTWPSWHVGKGLFAGLAAGAVVFLVVISQAFPQVLSPSLSSPVRGYPYFVVSNAFTYAENGSSRLDASRVSYDYKGTEIVIKESRPENPFQEFMINFHNGVHYFLLSYAPGLVLPESSAKDAWFSAYVQSGCVDKGETAVGHEKILDHATTFVQNIDPDGTRFSVWRAPDLGCFPLRSRAEKPLPNGSYRVTWQRDAVSVSTRRREGGWQLETHHG